ncbi:MAG: Alpha amylase, catalytic region [Thermoleophilia bacterium]|nr:Alpha amylase, catalytic region [Thermoleophilia bacterium]
MRATPASHPTLPRLAPTAWVRDAIVYGVIPSRFGPRGIPDVTARIDDLRDLGVDTLWLSPVNEASPGDFGYEVMDHRRLRSDYGRPADLRRLVREAHFRGMKVLLDVVPNHTFDQHRWFQDTIERGRESPYWNWYDRDSTGAPTHYFDWEHLPNLEYDNPKVRAYLTDAMLDWVRDYDVDGFRVDAAWAVQERRPDFWPELRRRLDQVKPGAMLLAEASALDPYWGRAGFQAAYDWGSDLGVAAWKDVFTTGGIGPAKVERLHRAIAASTDAARGASALTMRFLDNNDTGQRFAARHGADMARLGAALTMTLPGVPLLYTGQEVGVDYEPYAESTPLDFTDRLGLRPAIRELTQLRRRLPALRSDEFARYERASAPGTYGYTRGAAGPDQALVLFNFSTRPHEVDVDGVMRDELSGDVFTPARGTTTVRLPAKSVRVLTAASAT